MLQIHDPYSSNTINFIAKDNRCLKSKTLCGKDFLKIYEICYNHEYGVGTTNNIVNSKLNESDEVLAIHEVISSGMSTQNRNILSRTFSHNDVAFRAQKRLSLLPYTQSIEELGSAKLTQVCEYKTPKKTLHLPENKWEHSIIHEFPEVEIRTLLRSSLLDNKSRKLFDLGHLK